MRRLSAWVPSFGRARALAGLVVLAALGFAGCAQQPAQVAAGHPKEYFPESVYGAASRRIVENGPVPHGGGQYLVGKPYTVAGQTYYPSERKVVQVGNASWYGDAFHGRLTANGEIYDRGSFTAAHPTLPLPSYARVTNLSNHASMIVRVNDRGPFASNRIMDVSRRVAEALDFQRTGTAKVKVEYVGRASLAGSDDAKLYATLRRDGPAQWNEGTPATAVAEAAPPTQVASIEPIAPTMPEGRSTAREQAEITRPPRQRLAVAAPRPPSHRLLVAAREERELSHGHHGAAPDFDAIRNLVRHEPLPVERPGRGGRIAGMPVPARVPLGRAAQAPTPPQRHLDLATIPGADAAIGPSRHAKLGLRLSRTE